MQYAITKKIAKHGRQAVIIIPTMLQDSLAPGKLVEVKIEILESFKIYCIEHSCSMQSPRIEL